MSEEMDKIEESLRSGAEQRDLAALQADLARLAEQQVRPMLERMATEQGADVVPLLEELATTSSGAMAVAAAKSLGQVRHPAAASALHRLAETTSGDVRKTARRELHRLASLKITPTTTEAARPEVKRATWPVHQAVASWIDSEGHRAIWLGFESGAEIDLLALLVHEEKGILDVTGDDIARSRFEREVRKRLADKELPWVELPADYCRHLIEEAHARNASSGVPLSVEYLAWRDRIGRPEQVYEQPLVYSVINSLEVRWDPRTLDVSDDLLELEIFQIWALPRAEVDEFVRERARAAQSGLVLATSFTDKSVEKGVVDRAIQKLFDARRRARFKRRLEETSYMLWKKDRILQARSALAAALALEPPDRPLLDHPFIRALVELSLEVAQEAAEGRQRRAVKPGVQLYLPY